MTTDRKFCRFANSPKVAPISINQIPEEGFCLSSFVILRSRANPSAVLLGRMNPAAAWDHIGAMDRERVESHRKGWMIPSSHLIFGEAPEAAARRVLSEQLGLVDLPLRGPQVISEVWGPGRASGQGGHWDIEFLFDGEIDEAKVGRVPAWSELKFVDTRTLRPAEFARSHGDVLVSAGFRLA